MSGGDGDCVLAAATITINSPLRAVGTKPLVLFAADSIDVPASLDVGSHQQPTESIGAGSAPREACASGRIPGNSGGGRRRQLPGPWGHRGQWQPGDGRRRHFRRSVGSTYRAARWLSWTGRSPAGHLP